MNASGYISYHASMYTCMYYKRTVNPGESVSPLSMAYAIKIKKDLIINATNLDYIICTSVLYNDKIITSHALVLF